MWTRSVTTFDNRAVGSKRVSRFLCFDLAVLDPSGHASPSGTLVGLAAGTKQRDLSVITAPDHAGLHLRRRCPRLAAQMTAFQARQSVSFEAHLPAGDGGQTGFQISGNLAIGTAIGQSEDESRAEHISGRQGS